jgi:hypothetical protein
MKQLIIAGFHRSGTSATALHLGACGLTIGTNLLGASASNPVGHGEDVEVRRFHDRVLKDSGRSWIVTDPFVPQVAATRWDELRHLVHARLVNCSVWGFKDPRVCLFLPLWRHVLPGVKVLIVYRNPRDCAYSLARRHANELLAGVGNAATHLRFFSEPDLALRMWLLYNQRLIDFAIAHPEDVIVLRFDTLFDGFPLARQLNERWGLGLDPVNPGATIRRELLTEAPPHMRIASEELIEPIVETWSDLRGLEAKSLGVCGRSLSLKEDDVSRNDFKVDNDFARLRMENELLTFEVAFLKRAAAERESAQARHAATGSRAQARFDKVIDRLQASPLRFYLRRKKWFRKALARRSQSHA